MLGCWRPVLTVIVSVRISGIVVTVFHHKGHKGHEGKTQARLILYVLGVLCDDRAGIIITTSSSGQTENLQGRARGATIEPARRQPAGGSQPMRDSKPVDVGSSKSTQALNVRRATVDELAAFCALVDEYARGHPAEHHSRPMQAIRDAYFGASPEASVLIAERHAELVGFGMWRRVFDVLWAVYGGEMDGLFVRPAHRGRGIGATLVAAVCDDIRREGGLFLRASYTQDVARLYERVAIGNARRECHLSAGAFQAVADLSHCGPREMLRRLPPKRMNFVVE